MDSHNDKNLWHYSNSSNNPYHNQPTYNPYRKEAFAVASLVLGSISLLSACTFILPIPLGALGILFAVMAYRKGKKTHYMASAGTVLSCIGIFATILLFASYLMMMPTLLKSETFRKQLDSTSEQMYGKDFQEMVEDLYGIDINEYLEK